MAEIIEIDFLFGSDSDKDKIMPGLLKLKKEGLVQPVVHFISADNNSEEEVDVVVERIRGRGRAHEVYIGGAGLCNQLAGTLRKKARLQDLAIAVPISDSTTGGLSSFLSTTEKPPMNPLLTVGIDNTYAAGNIAYRFMQQKFSGVHVARNGHNTQTADRIITDLDLRGIASIVTAHGDDIIVTPLTGPDHAREVEFGLRGGVQIAVAAYSPIDFIKYAHSLDGTVATAMVNNVKSCINTVYAAAQLIQNQDALEELARERQKKAEHLRKLERVAV